ncbi:MAG: PUR family DNA/RNA-binding protein [Bacteroides sp.]|nr:PUR family DNA/RNA-binding protein [Bacteroides sp.]
MEEFKKKSAAEGDKEIVFSKAIKAGKRIYYLDVKKNRKEEMFLAITESKKIISGEGDNSQVNFEKHKIFLYKEDFEKFMTGLQQAIQFIADEQGLPETILEENEIPAEESTESLSDNEIKIDIDF